MENIVSLKKEFTEVKERNDVVKIESLEVLSKKIDSVIIHILQTK